MMETNEARSVAAGWISSSPHDANLTAFATGHPRWTSDGLIDEVERNIADVERNPQHYDDPAQCATELRELRDWAAATQPQYTQGWQQGALDRAYDIAHNGGAATHVQCSEESAYAFGYRDGYLTAN